MDDDCNANLTRHRFSRSIQIYALCIDIEIQSLSQFSHFWMSQFDD